MITELIKKLEPHLPAAIYAQIPGILSFGIDGPLRLANMLGQCMEETGIWTHFTENLNYSGERLWDIFPRHFEGLSEAMQFAHQPEKIANRIYSNRMGNGDESSNEGYLYRGRGALQLTGKSNYKALGDFLGVDLVSNPDLVATDYCMASAAFFFKSHNLWKTCDLGVSDVIISQVCKVVNGGFLALDKRIKYTQEVYSWLTS